MDDIIEQPLPGLQQPVDMQLLDMQRLPEEEKKDDDAARADEPQSRPVPATIVAAESLFATNLYQGVRMWPERTRAALAIDEVLRRSKLPSFGHDFLELLADVLTEPYYYRFSPHDRRDPDSHMGSTLRLSSMIKDDLCDSLQLYPGSGRPNRASTTPLALQFAIEGRAIPKTEDWVRIGALLVTE